MTENEAIERIKDHMEIHRLKEPRVIYITVALSMAITALKVIQQYREIGTVEECQEAVEKQKPKAVTNGKLIKNFYGSPYCIKGDCPTCGRESIKSTDTDYCYVCGQHLKYDENLEGMEDE